MRPVIIAARVVRGLVSPPMSRATLMRWTRDAGVKPVRKRGPHCYYKVTEVARMMGIDKEEIYERSLG